MNHTVAVTHSPPRYLSGWETWVAATDQSLAQTVQCAEHGMGHLEEQLTTSARELQRQALERGGQATKVIRRLEQLELRSEAALAETVARERKYFQSHRERLDYTGAAARGWPLGATVPAHAWQ